MYTTMLDLAVSMIFLFLMLSAASSAIQEIISNFFRWRAKTLEKGIAGLLGSEQVKNELYRLPLLQSLCSPNARGQLTKKPSYIPSSTFALAVMRWAEENRLDLTNLAAGPAVAPTEANSEDPKFRVTALLQSLLKATDGPEKQKQRIEDWFDKSMDRVSGWYKRKSHMTLWIIGILICLLVNADSISLANAFWNDQTLRAAMVTAATEHVKNAPKEERTTATTSNAALTTAGGGAAGQTTNSDDTAFKRLKDVRAELAKVNIPLGWCWYGSNGGPVKTCFPFSSNPVTFTFNGNRGNAQYDYWIVANYENGKSSLAGPFSAKKAPDVLTDKNYVVITWQAVTGAKTYDVLRKSEECICAVARGLSGLTVSDKSDALKHYEFAKLTKTDEESFPAPQVTVIGKPGTKTYKYWIVPNYDDGKGSPVGPFTVTNAPETLSGTNYVVIGWQPVTAAKDYTILRTGDDKLPTGECNCAVKLDAKKDAKPDAKTDNPGLSVDDKSTSLQPYKYGTLLQSEDAALLDPRIAPPWGWG